MSFAEKMAGLMARPGQQDPVNKDDVPWMLKYSGRILGIVGAFFAILFGLYNCFGLLTLNAMCVVSGVLQMCLGAIVMAIEAPCCCMFVDHIQKLAETVDNRPYWNRAAFYCLASIFPIIFCPGLGSIFGAGLIFGTGVLYGMMSLGKKATSEQMRNAATAADNRNISSTGRANLVNNAQPISITGVPSFDSNINETQSTCRYV